jgi:hypothetical protein
MNRLAMNRLSMSLLAGGTFLLALSAVAQTTAPSASTIGAGSSSQGSATVGSGGSAASGGTSATTLGTGGTSTGPAGTSSTIGGGGSAATTDGKATTSDKIKENPQGLSEQSRAKAQDGGTWSKSRTTTKIGEDEATSSTRSMSHAPGGPPVKSIIEQTVPVQK